MTITGNNKNHVIAWGGGFNINNGERVNFNGSGKAFLNLILIIPTKPLGY